MYTMASFLVSSFTCLLISTSLGSQLKGIGLATYVCDDVVTLNASWFYDWKYYPPCDPTPNNIPWIPMIFGADEVQYASQLKGKNYEALLGFNEPDWYNQANMTPDEALSYWPQLMDTGLRLGSPAASQWGVYNWTVDFMNGVEEKGYRVDFMCFHWYAKQGYTIDELKEFLDKVTTSWPGYPIWITEFANATGDYNDNIYYMQNAIELFKNYPIERFSWFTNREDGTQYPYYLLDYDTVQPTPPGQVYINIPNGN